MLANILDLGYFTKALISISFVVTAAMFLVIAAGLASLVVAVVHWVLSPLFNWRNNA